MKSKKNIIINSIIFTTLIFITYYVIFKDKNIYQTYKQINKLNLFYILIALITMILYYLIEAINVKNILITFKEKITILKTFRYTLVAFFFSSITPGATGGQPVEVYYLNKEGIKVSNSTIALLIHLCGYHLSSIILAIIGSIVNPSILNNGIIYFFIFGTFLNTIPVTITIIGIFFPKLSLKLVNLTIRFLKYIKLKNIDNLIEKINEELKIYQESSQYIQNNKKTFINAMFLATIDMIVYYTVPFLIYKSFGLEGKTIIDIILLQAVLHGAVCSMPLPGTVGISETVFLVIYSIIYPSNLIQSALVVTRFISFYLFVFISLIAYIVTKIRLDSKKSRTS